MDDDDDRAWRKRSGVDSVCTTHAFLDERRHYGNGAYGSDGWLVRRSLSSFTLIIRVNWFITMASILPSTVQLLVKSLPYRPSPTPLHLRNIIEARSCTPAKNSSTRLIRPRASRPTSGPAPGRLGTASDLRYQPQPKSPPDSRIPAHRTHRTPTQSYIEFLGTRTLACMRQA
ncbi:hypothetical protein IWZ00DRAFT_61015 [Phyllosticta capitalensis]